MQEGGRRPVMAGLCSEHLFKEVLALSGVVHR